MLAMPLLSYPVLACRGQQLQEGGHSLRDENLTKRGDDELFVGVLCDALGSKGGKWYVGVTLANNIR